jgi:unsaturated rhamnogalacturonyl hydrolase
MKNLILIGILTLSCFSCCEKPVACKEKTLLQTIKSATLSMQRKDWEHGSVAQAFLESGDTSIAIQMAIAATIYTEPNGRLAVLGGSGLIDCAMLGEALYVASQKTNEPLLLNANSQLNNYILNTATRADDGTIYHAGRQMWVDSYNCAIPYLASMGNYDEALRQEQGLRKRLWDPEAQLYFHIWDDGDQKWINKTHWGVGNGWAAVGLTRLIRSLPDSRKAERDELIKHLSTLLHSCVKYIGDDGLFHNTIDNTTTFIETNLSHMLAYSIYSGIKGGWLDNDLKKYADRMRKGALSKVDKYGFAQGVCGAPTFDKPGIAPEGQAFLILMESAAF